MFVLSFLFLTVCLLCLSLSWVSYGDVEKSTHPMSAQCAAGEPIVIDLASAPTPWRWRWQWQRDWGLGERERKYIALYLQLHSNNVNTKLYFCLVYISTSSNSQSKFSISCVSPVIFPSPSCSYFFPTLPHSLCLYLPPLSPLVFLAGTVVLLSNVTSARLGQILQWSCLHLALNIGRGRKNRYTAEGSRGSDTQVESLSLCCTICRCEGSGFQPSKLCKMFVFMRDCVCIDEVCLSSVCCLMNDASLWLWAFWEEMVDQTQHANAKMPGLVSTAGSEEPQSILTAQCVTRSHCHTVEQKQKNSFQSTKVHFSLLTILRSRRLQ